MEGRSGTVVWSTVTPFTGAIQGHTLAQPTPRGALIAATNATNVPLALQWFDPYGFFVQSINGTAGTATAGWAFKIGQTLATTGADGVTATNGEKVLFYYTKYDPVTFATQPTLGISDNASSVTHGGKLDGQGALGRRRRPCDPAKRRAGVGRGHQGGPHRRQRTGSGDTHHQGPVPSAGHVPRQDPRRPAVGSRHVRSLAVSALTLLGGGRLRHTRNPRRRARRRYR